MESVCIQVMPLHTHTHTHTHTLLILWFGFIKQVLRHVFQEFIEKAFLMATHFLEELQSTSPQNQQHTLVNYLHLRGAIPELTPLTGTSLLSCQNSTIQVQKHRCVCTYTHYHEARRVGMGYMVKTTDGHCEEKAIGQPSCFHLPLCYPSTSTRKFSSSADRCAGAVLEMLCMNMQQSDLGFC